MKRRTPEEVQEWRKRSMQKYQAKRQYPRGLAQESITARLALRRAEKPVTAQVARKRAADAEYVVNAQKRDVQARGRCEFVRDGIRCPRPATQTHHVVRRSHHVDHSVANLRRLCLWDHQFLHLHVELAKEWGWIRTDWPQIGESPMES